MIEITINLLVHCICKLKTHNLQIWIKCSEAKETKRAETEEVKCSESKESDQEIKAKKADYFEVIE